LLTRLRYDDEHSLMGVLRDLCESSLVFASGSGKSRVYRQATNEDLLTAGREDDGLGLEAYLWTIVYREQHASLEELAGATGLEAAKLEAPLAALIAAGRVERVASAGREEYRARELVLGLDDPAGWEASVLDHFSAMVQTVTRKLALDQRARLKDEVGGSTYHFKLWRGHPLQDEVVGELARFRERMSQLRRKVDEHNAAHPDTETTLTVHADYGQWLGEEEDEDDSED
jgi:hypothetical protein